MRTIDLCKTLAQYVSSCPPPKVNYEDRQFGSISSSNRHVCALRSDSRVRSWNAVCWGQNLFGQMDRPTDVVFSVISSGHQHTCGLRSSDGTAVCWGVKKDPDSRHSVFRDESFWDYFNDSGQERPPRSQKFVWIDSGGYHTCALRPDGGAVCWGDNRDRQPSPPAGEKFKAISSGRYHTCALRRSDGSAVCWGLDKYGQASPIGLR